MADLDCCPKCGTNFGYGRSVCRECGWNPWETKRDERERAGKTPTRTPMPAGAVFALFAISLGALFFVGCSALVFGAAFADGVGMPTADGVGIVALGFVAIFMILWKWHLVRKKRLRR